MERIGGLGGVSKRVKIIKKRYATTFTFLLRFRGDCEEGVWLGWIFEN